MFEQGTNLNFLYSDRNKPNTDLGIISWSFCVGGERLRDPEKLKSLSSLCFATWLHLISSRRVSNLMDTHLERDIAYPLEQKIENWLLQKSCFVTALISSASFPTQQLEGSTKE